MTRRVVRLSDEIAEADHIAGRVETIDRRGLLDFQTKHPRLAAGLVIQGQIGPIEVNGNTERAFCLADS